MNAKCETAVKNNNVRLLLDSGAFSAWRSKKEVSLDAYCQYVEDTDVPIWRYFALDVVGDSDGTQRNLDAMNARDLKPIPVFTRSEDPAKLDDLYQRNDLVGIGGLVGTPKRKGFVKAIQGHIGDRRSHWLGFTQFNFLKHFKPYSVDSTTWTDPMRYGAVPLYMGDGEQTWVYRKHFVTKPSDKICRRLRRYGIEPGDLALEEHWTSKQGAALRDIVHVNAVALALDVEAKLGTKFFLATGPADIDELTDAHRRVMAWQ